MEEISAQRRSRMIVYTVDNYGLRCNQQTEH